MLNCRRRVAGISGVFLSFALLGCSGEVESPPAPTNKIEITDTMEKMKEEMMRNNLGKRGAPKKALKAAKPKD